MSKSCYFIFESPILHVIDKHYEQYCSQQWSLGTMKQVEY